MLESPNTSDYREAAEAVFENGGHTEFTEFAKILLQRWEGRGYVVAESKDSELKIWMGNVLGDGDEGMIDFIAYSLSFFHGYNRDASIGAWIDGDFLYLDRVQVYQNLHTALLMGRARQQLGIYSIHEDKVYNVEETLAQNSENGTDGQ